VVLCVLCVLYVLCVCCVLSSSSWLPPLQGLIIDSFGELRDRLEAEKEDDETKCFVCGLSRDELDKEAHGFERHVHEEHRKLHYLFFFMHVMEKRGTEHTGQESYVHDMYLRADYAFFPLARAFRTPDS
jgi:hypothetical protein